MTKPLRAAVVVFPGSNREGDVARALRQATGEAPAMVWHASRRTQRPSLKMRSVSSAKGMNSMGPSRPREGWCQRTSASMATMRESRTEAMGW